MIKRNILLNPGPATTTDTVKYAQVIPDICPREKEFGDLMETVSRDLTKIAGGDERFTTILFAGSGTASVDATINSVVPPNKKILVINNGAYGERMALIAKTYGIPYIELKSEWEKIVDVNIIEKTLKENIDVSCIAVVHHETTTGILNPIEDLGRLAKQYDKTLIVDTISSFAGVPLDIKKFNIDFMMSTSNKCIQGMAGVCFVICKIDALEKIKSYPRRSFYLSLYDQYDYFKKQHQMRFTPPVQTIYALRKAIDEFILESYERRVERYTKNWQVLREGVKRLGFQILTKPEDESHILITLLYPEDPNFDFDKLHDRLYARGFTIYPGKVGKTSTFRLANMGAIDHKDIELFLKMMKETLKEMRVQLPPNQ